MESLTLITPTSDRPAGIDLARRWLLRQRLDRPLAVQWLVCDDGQTKADLAGVEEQAAAGNAHLRLTLHHVQIPPARTVPLSFRGNVAAGLCRAAHDWIAVWEDDDWYPADYLEFLRERFERGYELIGQSRAKYYNVRTRRHRTLQNAAHASLCQTAMTRRLAEWLEHRCRNSGGTYIDMDLWRQGPACQKWLHPHSTVVGIKGLPGKSGIGMGHRLGDRERCDRDFAVLPQWIGEEAETYRNFAE